MTEPFEVSLRYESDAAVLDFRGELDARGEGEFFAAYDEAASQTHGAILLNFSGVDYINSKGIALIVDLMARARQAGRVLLAFGVSPYYREIFEITRLTDYLRVFSDESDALDAASGAV